MHTLALQLIYASPLAIKEFVDAFTPYKQMDEVIDLKTKGVKTTLRELSQLLESTQSAEAVASKAFGSSQQAITNYRAMEEWLPTTPAGTQKCYVDDAYETEAERMWSDMIYSSPSSFGSPDVTRALTLPNNNPEKYELLFKAFAKSNWRPHNSGGGSYFNPEYTAPPEINHLFKKELPVDSRPGDLQPRQLRRAKEIANNIEKVLGCSVTYDQQKNMYVTNLRTSPENIRNLRILLANDQASLDGVKMKRESDPENLGGMIVPASSRMRNNHDTICLDETAAKHLVSYTAIGAIAEAAGTWSEIFKISQAITALQQSSLGIGR